MQSVQLEVGAQETALAIRAPWGSTASLRDTQRRAKRVREHVAPRWIQMMACGQKEPRLPPVSQMTGLKHVLKALVVGTGDWAVEAGNMTLY